MNGWNGAPGPMQVPLNPATGQPYVQQMPMMQMPQMPQQQFVPQMQMPAQMAPQQMQSRPGFSGEEILDGASVPPELRGRKLSDAMRIYTALAGDFLQRNGTQQRQIQQPQQHFQGQPQAPQGAPQQVAGQPNAPRPSFWQDPNPDDRIAGIVRNVVGEIAQPMIQNANAGGIQNALNQARSSVPDFQALEPDIMEAVKGASAESLIRPDFWIGAADLARGKRSRPGQLNPNAQRPALVYAQPQQFAQQMPQQPYPQPQMPQPQFNPQLLPGMNPAVPYFPSQRPPTAAFFTEAPTAPSPYANTHNGALTLSDTQRNVARLAGMSDEQYAAWAQLSQPMSQNRR